MTLDLRPKWLNVTRSLQKAACKNNGIAVLSSQIVVDNSGNPITWTEPNVTRLGPLSSQDELIRMLGALTSRAYHDEFLIAQVLDERRIVINKGEQAGMGSKDWFVYIDNDQPYAILSVNELRDRITILSTLWVSRDGITAPISVGDPVYRLHW